MTDNGILREGHNCWRCARADRLAFLIDGEAYFSAFAAAVEKARSSIFILGWDIDSRIRLRRDGRPRDLPDALGGFLNEIVSRRKGLQAHVLDWDFAMLYALEREPLPIFQFGWRTHRRLHFALDSEHPVGASHHQKIVVVDDRVAFVGGFDLARNRWDTSEHAPQDERRVDHDEPYPPFHDVQVMVEGEVAGLLGDLARERWRWATGSGPQAPENDAGDPWPEGIEADLSEVEAAISRTIPAFQGRPEICEVKQLFLDAIAAAQKTIYIESQYLTAAGIGEALAVRLAQEDGPEVVLVLPRECSGWLEESTMGVLRSRLLQRLRGADRFGRLGVYYPTVDGLEGKRINVHSKVMVVDDLLVRVGSANLNNRSMGFDTECDLAVEALNRIQVKKGIQAFRDRLLGEHLGVDEQRVKYAVAERGSLLLAVEALRNPSRSLEPLVDKVNGWLDEVVPDAEIIDPERPVRLDVLVDELLPPEEEEQQVGRPGKKWLLVLALALTLGVAAAWRWTPMSQWLDPEIIHSLGRVVQGNPLAPLFVTGAFILGGLVLFPVTLLVLATALTFSPITGFVYALTGCLLSALSTYGIGRMLGRDAVRRLAGIRLNRISRWLGRRGLLAVTAVRLVPVAPFSVINMVAGASHIRLADFFFGTLLGMTPGVIAITVFGETLEKAIKDPQAGSLLILGCVLAVAAGLLWALRRRLGKKIPLGVAAREEDG